MSYTVESQSAISVLIRFVDDLIKILRLANLAFYLYGNIMLSILSGQIPMANISRAFLYAFSQSSVLYLIIATFSATVPV